MDVAAVTRLLALLTAAGWVALGAGALLVLAARAGSSPAQRLGAELRAALAEQGTALALLVAVVATVGSLYLSEVAHFVPCRLCWYQRIAMYPLFVVLGLALWRGDRRGARAYGLGLALPGAAVSLWHVGVERIPALARSSSCEAANPCTLRWVDEWGFVTIPLMALTAFALVAVLVSFGACRPGDAGPQ